MRGFTIVELLIAIVVIAILATISILAYNDIQKRAGTAAYTAAVDGIEKQLRIAATQDIIIDQPGSYPYRCIGDVSDFPAEDDFAEGSCATSVINGVMNPNHRVVDQAFTDQLKAAGVSMPGRLPTVNYTDSQYGYKYSYRGITAIALKNSRQFWLNWRTPERSSCGRGTFNASADVASCTLMIKL